MEHGGHPRQGAHPAGDLAISFLLGLAVMVVIFNVFRRGRARVS